MPPSPRASAIFPPCGEAAAPPHDLRAAETTTEKAHGRIETRAAQASAEVVAHIDWPGAEQVLRIARTREIKGKVTTEIAYYVTSLAPEEAGADRLMALARAHWGIENRLHWRRDASMNEDRCRVRAGARPFASLRNVRDSGMSVPAAREGYAADWSAALGAVTGGIL